MFRSLIPALLIILSLVLSSCSIGIPGVQRYVSTAKGYEFLYPNGWVAIDVKGGSEGVDIIYRDLVEQTENLSVVISTIPADQTLKSLGTPTDVGYRFMKKVNNAPNSDREAELIGATERESDTNTYYLLEYQVNLPNGLERHNLASVAVSNGKLYTFNVSTRESRWKKVKSLFQVVVKSFRVY